MANAPPTALISVSNKVGLVELGQALAGHGFRILSTGGSAACLREAGVPVTEVSEHTQFPEIMAGRVKTLHPKIHGGILARRGEDDAVMSEHGIEGIDWVVVNLYPFAETTKDPHCTLADAIEQIDIGGPSMVRSAAKNHQHVTVVCDPDDYPMLIETLPAGPDQTTRQRLAVKAFAHTAAYDSQISQWLSTHTQADMGQTTMGSDLPPTLSIDLDQTQTLRYGENPHQQAGLYAYQGDGEPQGVAGGQLLQGKPLSFNNLLDADAAWSALQTIAQSTPKKQAPEAVACVVVKHTNPCGAAVAASADEAWDKALACDPTSAFGGIVAFSAPIDAVVAAQLVERFLEVILAPTISEDALAIFAQKPNLRVLAMPSAEANTHAHHRLDLRPIEGGMLVQTADVGPANTQDWTVVSQRQPTDQEMIDLTFAWAVVRSTRSNAIVYAKQGRTLGLGVGQMSRIDSARFGVMKSQAAGHSLMGAAMASEAFFPFADSIEAAAEVGISCIIQPGGSMRDQEVIAACDKANIAMVFTHQRHFKH